MARETGGQTTGPTMNAVVWVLRQASFSTELLSSVAGRLVPRRNEAFPQRKQTRALADVERPAARLFAAVPGAVVWMIWGS